MNLNKYLPFENYTLTTEFSTDEVYNRLSAKIENKQISNLSNLNYISTKEYEGVISKNSFRISRVIGYRNSFLPIIEGNISTYLGQTQIKIKMRPATFVLIFMFLWFSVIGIACLGILLVGIFSLTQILQTGFSPMLLIPFGLFIFGCLLMNLAFKGESKNSKEFLATLLRGQENI